MSIWQTIGQRTRAAFLPQDCFLCGLPSADEILCHHCVINLPRLGQHCWQCGLSLQENGLCGSCMNTSPAFDRTISAFHYDFPMEHIVGALKYQNKTALAPWLADRLLEKITSPAKIDLIIPLPLHPQRLRERGFNQSLEIAHHLAKKMRLSLDTRHCIRVKNTQPQTTLPWKKRQANVRGAFVCNQDLSGKSIAVVDDVMTTGATLAEFAKTLKKRGALRVENWVIARTLPRS